MTDKNLALKYFVIRTDNIYTNNNKNIIGNFTTAGFMNNPTQKVKFLIISHCVWKGNRFDVIDG